MKSLQCCWAQVALGCRCNSTLRQFQFVVQLSFPLKGIWRTVSLCQCSCGGWSPEAVRRGVRGLWLLGMVDPSKRCWAVLRGYHFALSREGNFARVGWYRGFHNRLPVTFQGCQYESFLLILGTVSNLATLLLQTSLTVGLTLIRSQRQNTSRITLSPPIFFATLSGCDVCMNIQQRSLTCPYRRGYASATATSVNF